MLGKHVVTMLIKISGLLFILLQLQLTATGKHHQATTAKPFFADSKILLPSQPLHFDSVSRRRYKFWYEGKRKNAYLDSFRKQYKIDIFVQDLGSDSAKALRIMNWTHRQWSHNGANEPSRSDAFTILQEAGQGKKFRCVEYSIVATTALNAAGLPARILSLKTSDAETRSGGAGHVVLEVYLQDQKKWAMLDGQWNMMPVLHGRPLNGVELQHALATDYNSVEFRSLSGGISKQFYAGWVRPYLYFFDVAFDNREGLGLKTKTHDNKSRLMLVPKNAKKPTVFQQKWPLNNFIYTHALQQFYAPPN